VKKPLIEKLVDTVLDQAEAILRLQVDRMQRELSSTKDVNLELYRTVVEYQESLAQKDARIAVLEDDYNNLIESYRALYYSGDDAA